MWNTNYSIDSHKGRTPNLAALNLERKIANGEAIAFGALIPRKRNGRFSCTRYFHPSLLYSENSAFTSNALVCAGILSVHKSLAVPAPVWARGSVPCKGGTLSKSGKKSAALKMQSVRCLSLIVNEGLVGHRSQKWNVGGSTTCLFVASSSRHCEFYHVYYDCSVYGLMIILYSKCKHTLLRSLLRKSIFAQKRSSYA